jgi:hypothetical protein
MKRARRNWKWLAGFLAVGWICATYVMAQIQTTSAEAGAQSKGAADPKGGSKATLPGAQETADAARLIDAINAGDSETAISILRAYKVSDGTLRAMATNLGKSPARATLEEPFLKACVGALATMDGVVKSNMQAYVQDASATPGYERPVWMLRPEAARTIESYNDELVQCPVPPIAVLDIRRNDPCIIRFFKWYDRYADSLHSVAVNGQALSNTHLDPENYNQADRTLNALFRLIKARKPNAFVWLSLVKKDDRTDEQWLKAMSFKPDGLQISNLRQFDSPFAETRTRYSAIVGADTPLMVAGFCGYTAALDERRKQLSTVVRTRDPQARQAAESEASTELGNIGAAAAQEFSKVETNLQSLGYRGLSANWLLLAALANTNKSANLDKSDLPGARVGLLDSSLRAEDYARVFTLATDMISSSAPGDMDWMAAKLSQGMAWLKQSPPDTGHAIAVLDEVLAVDFKSRPGRDHYILTAVRWRMYAAVLRGDAEKSKTLAQWVQDQPFRKDLKADFLKQHGDLVSPPNTTLK